MLSLLSSGLLLLLLLLHHELLHLVLVILLLLLHVLLQHVHLHFVVPFAPLPFALLVLSGSLSCRLILSHHSGHLLLLRPLLLLPLFLETPCLLVSVRSVSLSISRNLLHHHCLCLLLLLHHLLLLLLSDPLLLLALLVIASSVFGGSLLDGSHLSLHLCHLRLVSPLALFLVSLSSALFVAPHPVLPLFLTPSLILIPLPVLLSQSLFGLKGLLSHVLHSPPHLVLHLLLVERLLLSCRAIVFHRLHECRHDSLHFILLAEQAFEHVELGFEGLIHVFVAAFAHCLTVA